MDTSIFRKFSYGLYVIGSTTGGRLNGQIANTVFQISSEPPTVAISINKNNLTNEFIKESKAFSICILPQSAPLSFIGHFGFKSGRDIDKFQAIPFKLGATGVPILLENSLGYLEAEVINSVEVETHTVFIGKIINAELINEEEPLTYALYQQLKRGSTSAARPNADILQPAENSTGINKLGEMQKYECTVCGYIYDPAVGDPDSGIAPGTLFEDIPEDWICPVCGVPKSEFRAIG